MLCAQFKKLTVSCSLCPKGGSLLLHMDPDESLNVISSGVAASEAPSLADAALAVEDSTTGSSAARVNLLHALTILDIRATTKWSSWALNAR